MDNIKKEVIIKRGCLQSPSPKVRPFSLSILYPHREYLTFPWKMDFTIPVTEESAKDKPAASFFPQTKLVDRYKKDGCLYIPETDVSTLPTNRYSKAFGVFVVNLCTICSGYVSTVDVLITSFLQSSVQPKHLLSALASQCFPLTGASHLTRVQLKTQSYRLLWAVLSRWRKRVVVMVSHRKEGCYTTRLRCKVS